MNRRAKLYGALLVIGCTTAFPAWAQDSGFYFSANVGQAEIDADASDFDGVVFSAFDAAGLPFVSGSSDFDDNDTSFSFAAGFRITQNFSAEIGYVDLGTNEYRARGTVFLPGFIDPTRADASIDVEAKGIVVAGLGTLPLGESFDIHGRVGIFFAETDASISVSLPAIPGASASDDVSADSESVIFSIGAAYNFGEQWQLSLDFTGFSNVGDEDESFEADYNSITLGLTFRL